MGKPLRFPLMLTPHIKLVDFETCGLINIPFGPQMTIGSFKGKITSLTMAQSGHGKDLLGSELLQRVREQLPLKPGVREKTG